jgi:hypothetical protein
MVVVVVTVMFEKDKGVEGPEKAEVLYHPGDNVE